VSPSPFAALLPVLRHLSPHRDPVAPSAHLNRRFSKPTRPSSYSHKSAGPSCLIGVCFSSACGHTFSLPELIPRINQTFQFSLFQFLLPLAQSCPLKDLLPLLLPSLSPLLENAGQDQPTKASLFFFARFPFEVPSFSSILFIRFSVFRIQCAFFNPIN